MKKILKPKLFLTFALALSFFWMRESFGQTPVQDPVDQAKIEVVSE